MEKEIPELTKQYLEQKFPSRKIMYTYNEDYITINIFDSYLGNIYGYYSPSNDCLKIYGIDIVDDYPAYIRKCKISLYL